MGTLSPQQPPTTAAISSLRRRANESGHWWAIRGTRGLWHSRGTALPFIHRDGMGRYDVGMLPAVFSSHRPQAYTRAALSLPHLMARWWRIAMILGRCIW